MVTHADRTPPPGHGEAVPTPAGPASIDKTSFTPYYVQLKQLLLERLATEWPGGTQLPGEAVLCQLYGLSRTVVRQALNELETEGRVIRRKGYGTYAASPKVDESLFQNLTGLYEDVASRGGTLTSDVRRLEIVSASTDVANELEIVPGDPVVCLERLRFANGEPWVYVTTYLPAALVPRLVEDDLSGSLYELLETKYGVEVHHGRRLVEAVRAPQAIAEALTCRRGDPMLLLRSTSWDATGRAVEYFVAYHRGERSRFQVYLRRRK